MRLPQTTTEIPSWTSPVAAASHRDLSGARRATRYRGYRVNCRKTVDRQQFDEEAKALTTATPASGRQVSLRSAGGVLEVTPDD